jgi:segregation and condensation protein B
MTSKKSRQSSVISHQSGSGPDRRHHSDFSPENKSSDNSHQPESVSEAENVLFVPPVDESDIISHQTSVIGHRPESGGEERGPALAMEELRASIEAILYAAGEPVPIRALKKVFSDIDPEDIKKGLAELLEIYNIEGRGLQIIEVAGGYQITTRPEYHDRVSSMFKFKAPSRLTIQSLETLATIAYRQPVTIPEIMELRGVHSAGVVRTLLEKKLVRILGRKNVVGRPLLYGTTKEFLNRFGLKDLSELPRLEDMAELFGDDIALQLEERLGEKDASAGAAAVASDGSENGDVPSDGGAPGARPEGSAESDAPERGEGEKEKKAVEPE